MLLYLNLVKTILDILILLRILTDTKHHLCLFNFNLRKGFIVCEDNLADESVVQRGVQRIHCF